MTRSISRYAAEVRIPSHPFIFIQGGQTFKITDYGEMSLDEKPGPTVVLRSESHTCPIQIKLADARSVSQYIVNATNHANWDKKSVFVHTANPGALAVVASMIIKYSSLESVEYRPPCPVRLVNKDLTDLVRVGKGGPLPAEIATYVVGLWGNGIAARKADFYDVIKALSFIGWDRMLEYFYCHIATVALRYRDRPTYEVADALSPHCDTREPSPLEVGQKKRLNVFQSVRNAKRPRLDGQEHSGPQ